MTVEFRNRRVRSIGEAMIEMAPVEGGLYRRGFAGDSFNTAWHLSQWLGADAEVGMVTRLGTDAISDAFAAQMVADGMVLDGVSRDPARRMGLYLIELDGVERQFHYWRDSSAARLLAEDSEVLDHALSGAGLIHLTGVTLAILSPEARRRLFRALGRAREGGAVLSFDPNIRARLWSSPKEMSSTIEEMLSISDIALPSFDDEATHFGDPNPAATIRRMADHGVREIIVKNGAGPVHVQSHGVTREIPTPPVREIRDTAGAGDAFNAGYLASRLMGRDTAEAVAAGQRMAAAVLTAFGARATPDAIARLPRP